MSLTHPLDKVCVYLCVKMSGDGSKENRKRPGSRGVADGKLGQKLGNTV